MKTLDEIKHYFEVDLKDQVDALEKKRLHVVNRYSFRLYKKVLKAAVVLIVLAFVLDAAFPKLPFEWGTAIIPITALFALIYPMVIWFNRASKFKAINKECKQTLLPKIISFIDPQLSYESESGIGIEAFRQSLLFSGWEISKYETEDLVTYSAGNNNVRLAEVRAMEKSASKGRNSAQYHHIFSGMFMLVEFPKPFSSNTIIKKDARQSLPARAGKALLGETLGGMMDTLVDKVGSLNLSDDLVKIEDNNFEKYFEVRSKQPDEAKRLLTPHLRQKMVSFAEKTHYDIQFSFTGNNMNIAQWLPNLFEWDYNSSFYNFEKFQDYLYQLLFAISIPNSFTLEPQPS